jgi:hypothetical protein
MCASFVDSIREGFRELRDRNVRNVTNAFADKLLGMRMRECEMLLIPARKLPSLQDCACICNAVQNRTQSQISERCRLTTEQSLARSSLRCIQERASTRPYFLLRIGVSRRHSDLVSHLFRSRIASTCSTFRQPVFRSTNIVSNTLLHMHVRLPLSVPTAVSRPDTTLR